MVGTTKYRPTTLINHSDNKFHKVFLKIKSKKVYQIYYPSNHNSSILTNTNKCINLNNIYLILALLNNSWPNNPRIYPQTLILWPKYYSNTKINSDNSILISPCKHKWIKNLLIIINKNKILDFSKYPKKQRTVYMSMVSFYFSKIFISF